ncbi:MAG: WYL domain-containing protein [Cyanobacteria bacterium SIG26]|nr:WYL domain-containing protein [Cyanobacteria bacterium SIG26]
MKEFLKTNTVTYNLMSFTAFKSILIFSLLSEGPKTYKEIQKSFATNEYLKETVSPEQIRNYIYTLEEFGCKISKIKQGSKVLFVLDAHPFTLNISETQVKSIIKVFKIISKSIDINDLLALQSFFSKISEHINNEDLKIALMNVSPISNIDKNIIKNLMNYAKNSTEITFLYNSPRSGHKNITMAVDKLEIKNGKLYVFGNSSEHKSYSSFLVNRIIKIVSVNIENKTIEVPEIIVGYNYFKDGNIEIELLDCEKIIQEDKSKYLIEMTTKSKFEAMQRVLSHASKCKVLYPSNFKADIINELKKIKEEYIVKEN